MSRWLVSHFAPFNGASDNSSRLVVQALKNQSKHILFTESLPVSFTKSWQVLESYLNEHDIKGILALGQADGRKSICLERVALNWIDATIPDAEGEQPIDQVITLNGTDLWTSVAVREWLSANVQISYSAGTYVCNYLYYRCLEWSEKTDIPALFVHIPLLTSQSDPGFADLAKMEEGTAVLEIKRILERLP